MKSIYSLVIVSLGLPWMLSAYMFCTNDIAVEPTVGEIVNTIFPIPTGIITDSNEKVALGQFHEQLYDASLNTVYFIGHLPVPIRSLVSDGLFSIDLKDRDISFNDVYLVQENYAVVNFLCSSSIFSLIHPYVCTCWGGEALSSSMLSTDEKKHITEYTASSSKHWCISKGPVCTSRSMNKNCTVEIDPIRSACIYVRQLTPLSDRQANGLVNYNLNIPTVGGFANKWIENSVHGSLSGASAQHVQIATNVLSMLSVFLENFPTYIATMMLGFSILYVAEDLASNWLFQFIVTSVFGVGFFLVCFVYVLYSTSVALTKQSIPFASILLGPAIGCLTMMPLSSGTVRSIIYHMVIDFWSNGMFGIPYLGKVCVIFSAVLSVLTAHFWGLFQRSEREISTNDEVHATELVTIIPLGERILHLFLRGLGLLLLVRSTSNTEVSLAFLLIGVNLDNINYLMYQIKIRMSATTAQHMSMTEVDHIVADTTARELAKLRQYCAEHQSEINRKFGGDQGKLFLMKRFTDGDYLGIPYRDARSVEGSKRRTFFRRLIMGLVVATIIVAIIVMNCLVLSDIGVK